MARRVGAHYDTIHKAEHGKRVSLGLFKRFCEVLWLDYFEVCELLYLKPIPLNVIKAFRASCKKEGKTPLQVLYEFIRVYSNLV